MNLALGDNSHKVRPEVWNLREKIIQTMLQIEGWLSARDMLEKFPEVIWNREQQITAFLNLLKFMAEETELDTFRRDDGGKGIEAELASTMFRISCWEKIAHKNRKKRRRRNEQD